jgi:hypothetical protein
LSRVELFPSDDASSLPAILAMLLAEEGIAVEARRWDQASVVFPGSIVCIEIAEAARKSEGLKLARSLRLASSPYHGVIVLLSLEAKETVASKPGGEIISTPGVRFVRLPATPAELAHAILAQGPTEAECLTALPFVRRIEAIDRLEWLEHRRGGVFGSLFNALRNLTSGTSGEERTRARAILAHAANTGAMTALDQWVESRDQLVIEIGLIGYPKVPPLRFASSTKPLLADLRRLCESSDGDSDDERRALAAYCLEHLEKLYVTTAEIGAMLNLAPPTIIQTIDSDRGRLSDG